MGLCSTSKTGAGTSLPRPDWDTLADFVWPLGLVDEELCGKLAPLGGSAAAELGMLYLNSKINVTWGKVLNTETTNSHELWKPKSKPSAASFHYMVLVSKWAYIHLLHIGILVWYSHISALSCRNRMYAHGARKKRNAVNKKKKSIYRNTTFKKIKL